MHLRSRSEVIPTGSLRSSNQQPRPVRRLRLDRFRQPPDSLPHQRNGKEERHGGKRRRSSRRNLGRVARTAVCRVCRERCRRRLVRRRSGSGLSQGAGDARICRGDDPAPRTEADPIESSSAAAPPGGVSAGAQQLARDLAERASPRPSKPSPNQPSLPSRSSKPACSSEASR